MLMLLLVGLSMLLAPGVARAQDPVNLNDPTTQAILSAAQGIDPESQTAMQTIAQRLQARGFATTVMDKDGSPSDHKAWLNGAAWSWISSVAFQHGTFRWSPYVQVPYDGSGYTGCGIPNSARLPCPAWFVTTPVVTPTPAPTPTPVPAPAPTPTPVVQTVDLSPALNAIAVLGTKLDTLTQKLDAHATTEEQHWANVKSAWSSIGEPIVKYVLPAVGGILAGIKIGG